MAGKEGTTPQQLIDEIRPLLPADAQVKTGVQEAQEDKDDLSEFTNFIRYFLLAFAGIALFVGSFVIFNTLSITVAQRTREFATLRTLGASRRQVLRSVLLEAFVVGLLASVVGLFLGLGLAKGLEALFRALNLELPLADTVFATRTIVVSLIVGTVITVVAGLFPAIRATRVPPIAAVREGAELPRSRFSRFTPFVAVALIALALCLLGYAMFVDDVGTAERLLAIAGGVLLLFVGVAMISSKLVRPLAAVVGLPARWVGGAAGGLARRNSIRNPGRTAATAAALMIGVALVAFVATLANGMKASNRKAIEDQITANFIITSQDGYTPFVAAAGDAAADASSAETVTHVRSEVAEIAGHGGYLTGIDPELITSGYSFDWTEGSDATLAEMGENGMIVDENFAEDHDLAVGQQVAVRTGETTSMQAVVKGIYEPPPFYPLLGNASITIAAFDDLIERPRNQYTFVNVAGGPNEASRAQLEQATGGYPDARVQTREEWIDKEDRGVRPVPDDALRPARAVRDHQPVRDGQHARALRVRADARGGDAAGRRHDASPDPADDPSRERDHRADRRGARAPARDLPRRARDPGARRVRHPLRGAHRPARLPRRALRDRRPARGDHARPPCGQVEPPRGTPLRMTWGNHVPPRAPFFRGGQRRALSGLPAGGAGLRPPRSRARDSLEHHEARGLMGR